MDVLAIIIMLPFLVVFLWAIIEMLIVNPIQKKHQKPQIPPISQTPEESLPTFILFDNEEIVPAISEVAEKKEVFEEYPLVGLYVIEVPIKKSEKISVGKIIKQEGKYLAILFGENERKWEYPQLFLSKCVRFADDELQRAFERSKLIFMEDRVKLRSDKPLAVTSVTPPSEGSDDPQSIVSPTEDASSELTLSKALHMIDHAVAPAWVTCSFQGDMERDGKLKHGFHYDTRGERIYRKGCEVFGWNKDLVGKFGMMQIMYAYRGVPDGKSVWMLTHHNSVTPIATKATAMWWNTFVRDVIFEEWRNPTSDFYDDFSTRITFAKTTSKGYAFIGVYQPEQLLEGVDDNGKMHHIKVYRRIQIDYEG